MHLERYHQRGNTAPERARAGDKVIAKKRPSLGKAAGGFQSRFLASLRKRKTSDEGEELTPSHHVRYAIAQQQPK
jgi:hypothetical protein